MLTIGPPGPATIVGSCNVDSSRQFVMNSQPKAKPPITNVANANTSAAVRGLNLTGVPGRSGSGPADDPYASKCCYLSRGQPGGGTTPRGRGIVPCRSVIYRQLERRIGQIW